MALSVSLAGGACSSEGAQATPSVTGGGGRPTARGVHLHLGLGFRLTTGSGPT
ncbi:hypothetical protein STVIR_5674 [Streptomyces viridochromogenes Tue57]|uniref:Uncharacterized protein n=1 Tax=Streptomyces viridochromogenes Tue57 TaxID=1160705 RepID=L8PDG6_STRVR|nr:hypothetical protein STVIR_5674 [Streptomyces viridochromogenes Tue57]